MSKSFWILGIGAMSVVPMSYAAIKKTSPQLPNEIRPMGKSLFFDQSFDTQPVRVLITEEIIARYLTPRETPVESVASVEKPQPKIVAPEEVLVEAVLAPQVEVETPRKPAAAPTPKLEVGTLIASEKNFAITSAPKEPLEAKELLEDLHRKGALKIESRKIEKPKTLDTKSAAILVLDETAFLEGRLEKVPAATVSWLHPDAGLTSNTDDKGRARIPYPHSYSARYIVQAKGYLPAVGYAVKGIMSPVLLYRESRIGPILKSIKQGPQKNEHILLGKFISRNLESIDKMSFDEFLQDARSLFYSSGALGIFNLAAKEGGPRGDFLLAHLPPSLQYLLPKQGLANFEVLEWPAQLLDLKGLAPILTTTLLESKENAISTRVVDAFSGERPDSGIYASIGGQRGVFEPDMNGFIDFNELPIRPNVDLVEIYAQGYMKTWINSPSMSETLPDTVPLFTQDQLRQVLLPTGESPQLSRSYIVGSARAETFNSSVRMKIYNSLGQIQRSAQVHYFTKDGVISKDQDSLNLKDPRFVITNVPEGEYHIVAIDSATGHGLGIQVLRTQGGTVTQVQF